LNLFEIDAVLLGHFCDGRIIGRTASSAGLKILSTVIFVYSDENLHSKTSSLARHNRAHCGSFLHSDWLRLLVLAAIHRT
jgi:hypothetical protein